MDDNPLNWNTLDEIYNNRLIETNESTQKILSQLIIFVEKLSKQIESSLFQDLTKQNQNAISTFCDVNNPLKRSFLLNPDVCQEVKAASYCAPNVCNEMFKNDAVFQNFWFKQIFKMTKSNLLSKFFKYNQSIGIEIEYCEQSIVIKVWQGFEHPIKSLNRMLEIESKIDQMIENNQSKQTKSLLSTLINDSLNDFMPKLKNIVNDL